MTTPSPSYDPRTLKAVIATAAVVHALLAVEARLDEIGYAIGNHD